MDERVDVTIPVEPEAATILAAPRNRDAIGRLVSRLLRPHAGPSPLAQAIAEMRIEARKAGLSDADIVVAREQCFVIPSEARDL